MARKLQAIINSDDESTRYYSDIKPISLYFN